VRTRPIRCQIVMRHIHQYFFATLTLKAASELLYPTIAPPGSIVMKDFEEIFNHEVHTSAPATIILPTDTIPHVDDILPIIRMLPNEFSKQALIRPLAGHVQTQEELDLARDKICAIQLRDTFTGLPDPHISNPKGRPSTTRLTGPSEGRARGGGASRAHHLASRLQRNCSICHQPGHNRSTCPQR